MNEENKEKNIQNIEPDLSAPEIVERNVKGTLKAQRSIFTIIDMFVSNMGKAVTASLGAKPNNDDNDKNNLLPNN